MHASSPLQDQRSSQSIDGVRGARPRAPAESDPPRIGALLAPALDAAISRACDPAEQQRRIRQKLTSMVPGLKPDEWLVGTLSREAVFGHLDPAAIDAVLKIFATQMDLARAGERDPIKDPPAYFQTLVAIELPKCALAFPVGPRQKERELTLCCPELYSADPSDNRRGQMSPRREPKRPGPSGRSLPSYKNGSCNSSSAGASMAQAMKKFRSAWI